MLADIMGEGNWGLNGIEGRRIRDRDRRRGVIRSIGRERKLFIYERVDNEVAPLCEFPSERVDSPR